MCTCPCTVHAPSSRTGSFVADDERFGPFRHGKRLGILRAQAKHESEPVQQEPAQRDAAGTSAKQRVRTLEGALRFAEPTPSSWKADTPRSVARADLQRVALRPRRRLIEQGQATFGEGHALGAALKCSERRFCGLGVVAQRGHRLAASLEVHRELRGRDRHARGTLPFERGADLAVELRAGRWRGALVQHLTEERMPERIGRLGRVAPVSGTRRGEPQPLARELLAGLTDPGAPSRSSAWDDRVDAEFDTADGRRGQQGALLAPSLAM